jgi:hypothetical protein
VPPGTLDLAAIEEQLQDMFALARTLQDEAANGPGDDARPAMEKLGKVIRIIGALSNAKHEARRAQQGSQAPAGTPATPAPAVPRPPRAPEAYAPLPPRGQPTEYQSMPVPSDEESIYTMTPSDDPNAGVYAATPTPAQISFDALPARSTEPEAESIYSMTPSDDPNAGIYATTPTPAQISKGHYSTMPSFPDVAAPPAAAPAPAPDRRPPSVIVRDATRAAQRAVTPERLVAGGLTRSAAAGRHQQFLAELDEIADSANHQMEPDTDQIQRQIDALVQRYRG